MIIKTLVLEKKAGLVQQLANLRAQSTQALNTHKEAEVNINYTLGALQIVDDILKSDDGQLPLPAASAAAK